MNKFDKALAICVGDKNELRDWMTKPFLYGDFVYSTDAHVMLSVPKSCPELNYQACEHRSPEHIVCVMPKSEIALNKITRDEIKVIESLCPKVDDFDIVGENKDCKACDGLGTVEYEFEYDYRTHTADLDCPICDGDGLESKEVQKPNGKKKTSSDALIKIRDSYFRMDTFTKLIKVCEAMESDAVLVYQKGNMSASLFEIGMASMLVMPCYHDDNNDDKLFYSI